VKQLQFKYSLSSYIQIHKTSLYRILSNFRSRSDKTTDERAVPRDARVAATSISTEPDVTCRTQLCSKCTI